MRRSTHPGAIIREDVLPSLGKTPEDLAALTNRTLDYVQGVLSEKQSVDQDFADRIGVLFGTVPDLWIHMQRAYDEAAHH